MGRTKNTKAALVAFVFLFACGDGPAAEEESGSPEQEAPSSPAAVPPPADAFALPGLDRMRPQPRMGWPVQSVHITSRFGWRVDPVSGRGVRLHRGVDFRGAPGDLVLAIAAGTVQFVGHDPLLGNLVIVDHGDEITSYYGHLSDVLVTTAMPIDRGAAIGLVGNTGRSAAPHLHLTVKLGDRAIDPLELIGEPRYRPHAIAASVPSPPPPAPAPTDPTAESSTAGAAQPPPE